LAVSSNLPFVDDTPDECRLVKGVAIAILPNGNLTRPPSPGYTKHGKRALGLRRPPGPLSVSQYVIDVNPEDLRKTGTSSSGIGFASNRKSIPPIVVLPGAFRSRITQALMQFLKKVAAQLERGHG
jgi:hypothetical protein